MGRSAGSQISVIARPVRRRLSATRARRSARFTRRTWRDAQHRRIVIAAFRLEIVTRIIVQDLTMAVGAVKILDELPWTPYLDGDTIASRSWSSSGAALTITSGGTTATPKVTAVSAGTWYATEHIVTTSGQEDERSIAIVVRGLT